MKEKQGSGLGRRCANSFHISYNKLLLNFVNLNPPEYENANLETSRKFP